jgi:hypothetical protein
MLTNPPNVRKWSTTVLEIVGFALVVTGIWEVSAVAGVISAGVACVVVGWLLG